MKKNSKNKKGMTLVEVIIAMALLSGMSAMLVTVAVAAKKQNLENYYRNNEMYTQAVNAEQYNDNKTVNMNELKVNKFSSKLQMSLPLRQTLEAALSSILQPMVLKQSLIILMRTQAISLNFYKVRT